MVLAKKKSVRSVFQYQRQNIPEMKVNYHILVTPPQEKIREERSNDILPTYTHFAG